MSYTFIKQLKFGDKGTEVEQLQQAIIDIKQHICMVDGIVKTLTTDGDFGEITSECVEGIKVRALTVISTEYIKFKYKETYGKEIDESWLEINDIVHPLFGLLLSNWNDVQNYLGQHEGTFIPDIEIPIVPEKPLSDRMVAAVITNTKKEIGTIEKTGNNDGERVEWYQKIGSGGEVNYGGSPYCQYGANCMQIISAEQLQTAYKWWFNGYTPSNINKGKELGLVVGGKSSGGHVALSDIEVGDWGYIYSSSRRNARHIFLIVGIKNGNVLTIEFNTNSGGAAEGNGVWARTRPLSQVWAVLKWRKLYK